MEHDGRELQSGIVSRSEPAVRGQAVDVCIGKVAIDDCEKIANLAGGRLVAMQSTFSQPDF
jgi:hypothetical protein